MKLNNFLILKNTREVQACYRDGNREVRKTVGKNFKLKAKAKFVDNPLMKDKQ